MAEITASARAGQPVPEPVTAGSARPVGWPLLTQQWRDLTFLHWPVDAGLVSRLLPRGTRPDLFDGTTYAGLIAFRMYRVGWLGLPGLPYLGSFPETNVRLYSVGPDGRRGVVFRSLDAARLLPALAGRAGFRLPYQWSAMRVRRQGDVIRYASRRRWPGPAARLRLAVRIGEPLDRPSDLEHFLTARWGLYTAWYAGRAAYLPNEHPRWPLHRAALLHLEEDLLSVAGLPPPAAEPVSVLYSPGVEVRLGAPHALPVRRGPLAPGAPPPRSGLRRSPAASGAGSGGLVPERSASAIPLSTGTIRWPGWQAARPGLGRRRHRPRGHPHDQRCQALQPRGASADD